MTVRNSQEGFVECVCAMMIMYEPQTVHHWDELKNVQILVTLRGCFFQCLVLKYWIT